MIEHVVGKLPEADARWIVDRAQANPFYLEELLRVVRDGGKVGDDSNLPDTVLGMVAGRASTSLAPTPSWSARRQHLWPDLSACRGQGPGRGRSAQGRGRWLEILTKREILFSRPTADLREYGLSARAAKRTGGL